MVDVLHVGTLQVSNFNGHEKQCICIGTCYPVSIFFRFSYVSHRPLILVISLFSFLLFIFSSFFSRIAPPANLSVTMMTAHGTRARSRLWRRVVARPRAKSRWKTQRTSSLPLWHRQRPNQSQRVRKLVNTRSLIYFVFKFDYFFSVLFLLLIMIVVSRGAAYMQVCVIFRRGCAARCWRRYHIAMPTYG